MIHGPILHYLFKVGHFHYMMDEHISEYSSFEAFCIHVYSPLHARVDFHSPFDLVFDPCKLHTMAYPPSLGSSDPS